MKFQHIFFILLSSSLLWSCLVAPGVNSYMVVPSDTVMKYRKFIPSDEEIVAKDWTSVKTFLGSGVYRIRTYYPEKYQCTEMVTYDASLYDAMNGEYKEWWDDGFKKTEGQYVSNKKDGLWKHYSFDDGTLQTEVNYKENEKDGVEKIYKKSILRSSHTYSMGTKEGPFVIYDTLGMIINEGIFKADTIFQQSLKPDESGEVFKIVEEMPTFPGCESQPNHEEEKTCATEKLLRFIYSSLRYPADAREKGIQGKAVLRFVVDKEGNITDLVAIRGICQSIEAECLRVVRSMPKWNPGSQGGEPVKVQYHLPIKFKLQ